jgi:hypothetical protein
MLKYAGAELLAARNPHKESNFQKYFMNLLRG